MEHLLQNSAKCVCKHCKCEMTGYVGDDECSDCAWDGILGKAAESARKAVEEGHFKRTGERKTAGELLRRVMGIS